jgi:hypothetical protein
MKLKTVYLSICIILSLLVSCEILKSPLSYPQPNDSKDTDVTNKPIYIIGASNIENTLLATDNISLLFLKIDDLNDVSIYKSISLPEINDYSLDTRGNIWVATDTGITVIDFDGNIRKHINEEPFDNPIWAININHNSLLISISGRGVWSADVSFEGSNIIMQNLTMISPILTKKIEPRGLSILLGTHGKGLVEINSDTKIKKYNDTDDLTMGYVNDISLFNEKIFIATYSGIYSFTNEEFRRYNLPDKPKSEFVFTVQPLDKSLTLTGSAAGLFAYCEEIDSWKLIGSSDNVVYDIFIQGNTIYVASFNGLLMYSISDIKSIC